MKKKVKIAYATCYARDRFVYTRQLLDYGDIDYMCFETMSEITMSTAKVANFGKEKPILYDPYLVKRLGPILKECKEKGIKIISNQGWLDPVGAAKKIAEVAKEQGVSCKVAAVYNSMEKELTDSVLNMDLSTLKIGKTDYKLKPENIINAEVYFGGGGIKEALKNGADVVLTQRVVDSALSLGPLAYEFDWDLTNPDQMAMGTTVGHIMECSMHATGGNYVDPGYKECADPGHLGVPIAEFSEDELIITKAPNTGGIVSRDSIIEQIIYETTDPTDYKVPDVTLDLTDLKVEEIGKDVVRITGFKGRPRPEKMKVLVSFFEGYMNEEWVCWAGPGCKERAKVGEEVLFARLEQIGFKPREFRYDYVGVNSIMREMTPKTSFPEDPAEIILRLVCKDDDPDMCNLLHEEIDAMACGGPAHTGKIGTFGSRLRPVIGLTSIYVDRKDVCESVEYVTV